MRGSYKSGQKKVLSGSVYIITIGVILAATIALVLLLLAFLPAVEDELVTGRQIVSIESADQAVGVNSNPNQLQLTITYSDGTSEFVALNSAIYSGLDLTKATKQEVAVNYGGFEQTIVFDVKEIDCLLRYSASVGGRIQGETEQSIPNGGSAATVVAVPETGYVFVDWNDGYPNPSRKDVDVTENKTYMARFEKAQFTVRFYYDDGTVASEEKVLYGEMPTKAPNPVADPMMKKYGYEFLNWVPMDYSNIDRDLDIRPEYVKRATDVILTIPDDQYGNAMGSVDIRAEGYYAQNQLATIVASPYNSREFAYWLVQNTSGEFIKVEKDGSTTIPVGVSGEDLTFTSVRSGSTVLNYQLSFIPTEVTPQLTIRAVFAYSNSDIVFINYQNPLNNNVELRVTGLPFGQELGSYNVGDIDLTEGLPVPDEVTGMQFEGWYLMGDSTQTVIDSSITFEQPSFLVAKWRRIQYTLQFTYTNDNNESHIFHTTQVAYQDTFASGTNGGLPLTNPTRNNYVFVGWQDALTGITVDDKTKLYADEKHLENDDFINNRIIRFIPIWTPISHSLSVEISGSGSVILIINPNKTDINGDSLEKREEILGEYTIYENNEYSLYVEALEGYELAKLTWFFAGEFQNNDYTGEDRNNATIDLIKTTENSVFVEFRIKKIEVNISNGDDSYAGHVVHNENTYASENLTLEINYGTNAIVKVISYNAVYSIADVKVDGVSIGGSFGDTMLEYSFQLTDIKENKDVEIIYSARKYTVNMNVGKGGSVFVTDFYNPTVEMPVQDVSEYTYGTNVYYRVKGNSSATSAMILRSMRINGILTDLFTNANADVKLYGWLINGESYGIDLKYINGEFYYVYGEQTYDGTSYVYCERLDENTAVIFIKTDVYGEDVYTRLSPDAENYENVSARLVSDLNVAARSVYNTGSQRDGRITSVDFKLNVRRDYNFIFNFEEINYSVTAVYDENGSADVSDTSPSYNGSSVLIATPKSGFYVYGYQINGEQTVQINSVKKGESYRLTLNNIDGDRIVRFIYEKITYKVTFINSNPSSGALFADGVKLNNSASFTFDYHSTVSIDVKIQAGGNYRISSVLVDDTPVNVHFNMIRYTYYNADLTSDVIVTITCAPRTEDNQEEPAYTLIVPDSEDEAAVSAEYIRCSVNGSNRIFITAPIGTTLSKITLKEKTSAQAVFFADNGIIEFTDEVQGLAEFGFEVPANTFLQGAEVEVIVVTAPVAYMLDTTHEGNGTVTGSRSVNHGDKVEVNVRAELNNYISSFLVNGEEIAVSDSVSNWSGLITDISTGNRTGGTYTYYANKDMEIEVVFTPMTYRLTVDSSSVNGTTTLSVGDSITNSANYGSIVHINMLADTGYHIAGLAINGKSVDVSFEHSDENDRKAGVYIYQGEFRQGNFTGVTEHLNVAVRYEINRYSFIYTIVNASANFASETNSGTLTSPYTLEGNKYYGIEHGSNFSFDISPAATNGYYLSKIRIVYKSMSSAENVEIVRYSSDGMFSSRGGTIWFNRFMDDGEGVTANIELIEVTFNRNLYTVNLSQLSDAETGNLNILYTHPTGSISTVAIFDAEGNIYYFRNGIIYRDGISGMEVTDIKLINADGQYVYRDGSGKVYEMLIEHGLRYTVTSTPALGYERIAFTVNGEDFNSLINDNRYGSNMARALAVTVTFRRLIYDVTFGITVVDKNLTGTLSAAVLLNYANIRIIVVEGDIYDLNYNKLTEHDGIFDLKFNRDSVGLTNDYGVKLGYGARVQFEMTPNFESTGYYLYNFVYEDREITELDGERTENIIYGGYLTEQGVAITGDAAARCSFRIMRYAINTGVAYTESILGETVNNLKEESGSTIAWGDDANVRVEIGDGFSVQSIIVTREGSPSKDVNLESSAGDDAYDEQMFYDKRNELTNEVRDVLVLKNVRSNIDVVANLERESFVLRYKFNDASNLDSVTTVLNERNVGYPVSTVSSKTGGNWDGNNIHVTNVRYYDEVAATIQPKNGYIVLETTATVRAVRYNEDTGEWLPVLDNAGNEIVTVLDLVRLTGDAKKFTFHNDTSLVAVMYVRYDLEIEFNIKVKTYDVNTVIERVNATTTVNTAQVSMAVKTVYGYDVELPNGSVQTPQMLTPENAGVTQLAEHHGFIRYNFLAPEGFVLTRLSVNGVNYTNFNQYSFIDERVQYTGKYVISDNVPYYEYSVTLQINDALVVGENYAGSGISVFMEIAPVTYTIKTYINGEYYENTLIGGRSGTTDGKTVNVFSPATVGHYNTVSISPVMYEGWRISGLEVKIGAFDSATDEQIPSSFNTSNPSAAKAYQMINFFLSGMNAMEDKLTVHVYYTTSIITYIVDIAAYAHSYDASLLGSGNSEGEIGYDTVAGLVKVYVTTGSKPVDYTKGGNYEYFSTVRVDAYANEGYRLYSIVEIIDGTEVEIINAVRGLTYSTTTDAGGRVTHSFIYTVNNLGNREFKVIYKQRTTVTLHVPNPFKYTSGTAAIGSMTYSSYVIMTARENGAVLNNLNESNGNIVMESYVYEVLVGNFVSFEYRDNYARVDQTGYRYCTFDGTNYVDANLITSSMYPTGLGKVITEETELYLINQVYARVTFEKDTNGAVDSSSGGIVYFNNSGSEPSNLSLYTSGTTVTKTLTITVQPAANYVFSNLYVRQSDREKSLKSGELVFKTGSSEWLVYSGSFNNQDSNGFNITRSVDTMGRTVFTVIMKGDMELRFEFYRVYELEYGIHYADRTAPTISKPGDDNSEVTISDIIDNQYAAYYTGSADYYMQYNSGFTLSAPSEVDGYVFVGWYVNDANTYEYLSTILPGISYSTREFRLSAQEMSGLINNGYEAEKLTIIARYQPIIDVVLFNELFYYDQASSHWNSWESGTLRSAVYEFNGTSVPSEQVNKFLTNTSYKSINAVDYSDLSQGSSDEKWDSLMYAVNSMGISKSNNVYSNMQKYSLLYQNISGGDFLNNSWQDGIIYLSMDALSASVELDRWQYYNWNTNQYETINYTYEDRSYGMDSDGRYTVVNSSFLQYNFALSYLYAGSTENGIGMPYAVSSVSEDNRINNRPLIIRPKLMKKVRLELTQMAYINEMGGRSITDFDTIIHPKIESYPDTIEGNTVGSDGMTGSFHYGSTINIRYYNRIDDSILGDGAVVNYPDTDGGAINFCYRFIGWRINWTVNGVTAFRFVSIDDSLSGYDVNLTYAFGNEPPRESVEYQAVYIRQYRQDVYSYNVAGSADNYDAAMNMGGQAYINAPQISVQAQQQSVQFEFYQADGNTMYNAAIPYSMIVIEENAHKITFFMDAGASYDVVVDTTTKLGDATNIYNQAGKLSPTGYDPAFDAEYMRYINKSLPNQQEFAPNGMPYTGGKFTVSDLMSLDIQYYSKGQLIFENMMYNSGVTIPELMALYLTDRQQSKLTVWDVDADYGDGTTVADGKVAININLIEVENFFGRFDYSLKGFNSGNGIRAQKTLEYYLDSARSQSNMNNLFNPSSASYRRYVVIDYNDGYISGGSLLFGDPTGGYDENNTGNGSEDLPYKVYTVSQFQNVSLYFIYNEYTCKGVNFLLCNDLKLQEVTTSTSLHPYGTSKAWVPLTHYYNESERIHYGFNGVFDGGGKTIYGLAVDQTVILTEENDTGIIKNPLADFDYEGLRGYGIFGCVNGGTIKNLNIGNAFITLDAIGSEGNSVNAEYVGILTARAYNANFMNITFKENNLTAGRTSMTNASGSSGSRILITAYGALGVGMLAGYAYNSAIGSVDFEVSTDSRFNVEISGAGSVGGLVGIAEGSKMSIENIVYRTTANNDDSIYSGLYINDRSSPKISGGVVGSMLNGAKIHDVYFDKINLTVGNSDAITVGGIVGMMKNSCTMWNCLIESPHTDVSASKIATETTGVKLYAGDTANTSGDAMGSGGETDYGKAGAFVGLVINSTIKSELGGGQYALKGVFRFRAATAGGIAGVSYNKSLIQNFDLNSPSTSNSVRLLFDFTGSSSSYGGIVGANLSGSIVDNCSVTGASSAAKDQLISDLSNSYMYIFKKSTTRVDTDYGKVPEVDGGAKIKQNTISPNKINAGGLVGYNTAAVYNSFTQYARLTIKYENGAAVKDYEWGVYAGGIVGYMHITDTKSTYDYGWRSESEVGTGNIPRVQSCYTQHSSIVIAGYIWCDNNSALSSSSQMITGDGVAIIGGIVGTTSDNPYGQYAINTCYTYDNHYIMQIGAYGLTNNNPDKNKREGEANLGWYYTANFFNTDKKWTANRKGFYVDGGIYGIVGGNRLGKEGVRNGASNFCWSQGNTESKGSPRSVEDGGLVERESSGDNLRGVSYRNNGNNKANVSGLRLPSASDAGGGFSYDTYWSSYDESIHSTSKFVLDGGEIYFSEITTLFGGGFVGVWGALDGRVYQTDIATGRLRVHHNFMSTATPITPWKIEGVEQSPDRSYNDFRTSESDVSKYLVRGQGSALNF